MRLREHQLLVFGPSAQERRDFVYSCRVYRTEHGLSGQPSAAWVREALARTSKQR